MDDARTITQVGLAQFTYELPDLILEGRFFSVVLGTGDPIQTEVISITLDDKLHYMHRFVRYLKNVQAVGAAYGTKLPHRVPFWFRVDDLTVPRA